MNFASTSTEDSGVTLERNNKPLISSDSQYEEQNNDSQTTWTDLSTTSSIQMTSGNSEDSTNIKSSTLPNPVYKVQKTATIDEKVHRYEELTNIGEEPLPKKEPPPSDYSTLDEVTEKKRKKNTCSRNCKINLLLIVFVLELGTLVAAVNFMHWDCDNNSRGHPDPLFIFIIVYSAAIVVKTVMMTCILKTRLARRNKKKSKA